MKPAPGKAAGLRVLDPDRDNRLHAVEVLREALARAEKGEIRELCLVLITEENVIEASWTGTRDTLRRLGILDMLRHNILERSRR